MDDEIAGGGATPDSPLSAEMRAEGAQLIRFAFDGARASGRLDWWRMTVAVLKNRILGATDREFDEARWGAQSFGDFVGLYPDLVTIDDSTRPATVELVTPVGESASPGIRPGDRIRQDLWRGVLDNTSGNVHVWREGRAIAVPSDEAEDEPRLPTIDEKTLDEWRAAFIESVSPLPEELAATAQRWQADHLHDRALPGQLRGQWNGTLKQRVLERLEEWFDETGTPRPDDVVEPRAAPPAGRDASTESLRSLIVEAVGGMTREELEEIRLPPAALLRTRK